MVRVVDVDARARRRAQSRSDLEDLVVGVLWALFGWRVELLGLVGLVTVERLLAHAVGDVAAVAIVLGLAGGCAGVAAGPGAGCGGLSTRCGFVGRGRMPRSMPAWRRARFGALASCRLIVSPPVIGCGFVCGGASRCPSSTRGVSSLRRAFACARSA